MKPRTKFQKLVAAVNDKLPEFPAKAACWAYDNCIGHRAFRNPKSGKAVCLDCGKLFTADTAGRLVCPGCHRLTEVVDSYKRTHKESCYFSVAGVKDGLQYIRVSRLDVGFHIGHLPERRLTEVCRLWMDSKGQTAVTSRKGACGIYVDSFDLGSPIELRAMKNVHRMIADMNLCPAYRVIPELRRRGVRGKLPQLPLFSLLSVVMNDSRVETLLKARRTAELGYFLNRGRDLDKYWPSLRIAIRHGYVIGDIGLWADMLAAMMSLGADVRNPALICPPDLAQAHDRWVGRLAKARMREQKERDLQRARCQREEFLSQKARFFGIVIADDLVNIEVLDSIEAYCREGEAMRHCVFANSYHLKEDSVVLSAKDMEGNRVETVEFSLSQMKVVQSRGRHNALTPLHDHIVSLVNHHAALFKDRASA